MSIKENQREAWTEESVTELAKSIAVAVAKNVDSVPQMTFPDIYLGLKDALLDPSATAAGAGSAQPRAEGDERALFEEATCKRYPVTKFKMREGIYTSLYVQSAWEGWQDRAALDQGPQAATTASASGHHGASQALLPDSRALHVKDRAFDEPVDAHDRYFYRIGWNAFRAALARAPLPAQGEAPGRRKPPMFCASCRAEKVIGQDRCACGSTMFARTFVGVADADQPLGVTDSEGGHHD